MPEQSLPCPFCGSIYTTIRLLRINREVKLRCLRCGARGPYALTETEAIAAWNRRVSVAVTIDPESEEQIDQLARALFEMDKANWVAPDYSQHESYLRGLARAASEWFRDMVTVKGEGGEGDPRRSKSYGPM